VRNQTLSALVFVFLTLPTAAQFTTVTGTVTDPNGLPYANGTIAATLVLPGGTSPTLNGFAYTPPSQPAGLNAVGAFVMQLADNTVLLPGATQWNFKVCSAAGTVQPAGGKGPVCFTVGPLTISGTLQSINSQLTAAAQSLSSSNAGGAQGSVPFAGVCNATYASTTVTGTDDTAVFVAQLGSVMASSSTTNTIVFPAGKACLFNSAQITLPNNGDSFSDPPGIISSQNPLRLTCSTANSSAQLMSTGATIDQLRNGCVLLMTFNAGAGNAKLISLGMGPLEIDHLAFITNNPSDVSNFFLSTNTDSYLHDDMFIGAIKAVNGTPSVNDAIAFGGNATATPGMTTTSPYQGYSSRVERNWFNQVRRAFFCGTFCNGVQVINNTVWSQSGFATGGPFEINCGANCTPPPSNNWFSGNIIEVVHYLMGFNLQNATVGTHVQDSGCYDPAEFSTVCVNSASTAQPTLVENVYSGAHVIGASQVATSEWGIDTAWSRAAKAVMRTDDYFLNGKDGHFKTSVTGSDTITDTAPLCTQASGTCSFTFNQTWGSAPRCMGSWTGTGTLTGILKVSSTTSAVTCASSVGTDTAQCAMICVGAPR